MVVFMVVSNILQVLPTFAALFSLGSLPTGLDLPGLQLSLNHI